MERLTGVCLRLIALCALCALIEPAAESSPSWSGLRLIGGLMISASVLDFFLSLLHALQEGA
jgi:hypothetical protein